VLRIPDNIFFAAIVTQAFPFVVSAGFSKNALSQFSSCVIVVMP